MEVKDGYNFGIASKTTHILGSKFQNDTSKLKCLNISTVDHTKYNTLFQCELAKPSETATQVGLILRQATGRAVHLSENAYSSAANKD